MALADRLATQVHEVEEEKRTLAERLRKDAERLEQAKRDARIGELRTEMGEIDTQKSGLETLLTELKTVHENAKSSVGAMGEEKKNLAEAVKKIQEILDNPDFAEILTSARITSVDELLGAPDYAEEEEVQQAKALRESSATQRESARELIQERRNVKRKVRTALTEKGSSDVPANYEGIVALLEKTISDITREYEKRYYQVPEGKAEILEHVRENHRAREKEDQQRMAQGEIQYLDTVMREDIEAAQKYQEQGVKVKVQE